MILDRSRRRVTELWLLGAEERFRFLARSTPSKIVPFLLRHRYLVLAVLFNVPGNAIIGGGGGIGLIAGMSRLFPFPKYVLLVCLAITPVPLLFLLRAVQCDLPGTGRCLRVPYQPLGTLIRIKGTWCRAKFPFRIALASVVCAGFAVCAVPPSKNRETSGRLFH